MSQLYDAIVIGTGSMGSAACYQLAARGVKVVGLEQFPEVPHDQGSHAGQSRIIRKAYFEHPDYVPLLEKAYQGWNDLQDLSGEQLYYKTGLLYCGPSDHEVIRGVRKAAEIYHIELQNISCESSLFHFFNTTNESEMLLEPDAGFLLPEKAIKIFLNEARKKSAELKTSAKVLEWKKENGTIKVVTTGDTYYAKKLIITAGAWAGKIIHDSGVPLNVTRQVLVWVRPASPGIFLPDNFPCWMIAADNLGGVYYGFPYLAGEKFPGPEGLKFAWHYPAEPADPDRVNREVSKEELKRIIDGLRKYFPALDGEIVASKTCLYTNTPDENFIIDHLPGYDGDVVIACGFSGHGFKFVPVIGEILADLAIDGKTDLPIDFLKLKRF